jgi:hypothetical protein
MEVSLGKIAKSTGQQVRIPQLPPKEGWANWVQAQMDTNGLKDSTDIFDPKTGKTIKNVGDGYMFVSAFHHLAEKKASQRGNESAYTQDEQPAKGGDDGAKRFCFVASQAIRVLHGQESIGHIVEKKIPALVWTKLEDSTWGYSRITNWFVRKGKMSEVLSIEVSRPIQDLAGVFDEDTILTSIPERYEAGTQNLFGVMAMEQALKDLKDIGSENIEKHEAYLKNYIINNMKNINNVILYGDTNYTNDRLGVITFNIKDINYEEVALRMATEKGISLRPGKFCAHPYVFRLLGVSDSDAYRDIVSGDYFYGMVRASLGLYNTIEEIDIFLNQLELISNINGCNRGKSYKKIIRF